MNENQNMNDERCQIYLIYQRLFATHYIECQKEIDFHND